MKVTHLYAPTYLYALPSAVHIANAHKWIHMALHTMCPLPSIFLDPPLILEVEVWICCLITRLVREVEYTHHKLATIRSINHRALQIHKDTCYCLHMCSFTIMMQRKLLSLLPIVDLYHDI